MLPPSGTSEELLARVAGGQLLAPDEYEELRLHVVSSAVFNDLSEGDEGEGSGGEEEGRAVGGGGARSVAQAAAQAANAEPVPAAEVDQCINWNIGNIEGLFDRLSRQRREEKLNGGIRPMTPALEAYTRVVREASAAKEGRRTMRSEGVEGCGDPAASPPVTPRKRASPRRGRSERRGGGESSRAKLRDEWSPPCSPGRAPGRTSPWAWS